MRPPRLPNSTSDSLPISFSYRVHPASQRVEVIIDAPEEWSSVLMDGLSLLSHFTQQAKRHLEAGYRNLRGEQVKAELQTKYAAIQDAYRAHRAAGLKHRASVRLLVSDTSLPFHGQWGFSDFNWCIRSMSVPARTPKLQAVPASGEGAR